MTEVFKKLFDHIMMFTRVGTKPDKLNYYVVNAI